MVGCNPEEITQWLFINSILQTISEFRIPDTHLARSSSSDIDICASACDRVGSLGTVETI